uniref:S-protein homolog n=1 Tax=Nicotiana sylvestris TaxID=4096 RepID=A0A1U7YN18_NICSY|nr:PREDICTED: uncharacterized protein LOC104246521 [Nicotiana sylvestris]
MKTFKGNTFCMLLLTLLYLLVLGSRPLARGISLHLPNINQRVQVHVINRLVNGNPIFLHCQSHDNDLGTSIVQDGDEVNWSFRVNFWGTTLFYCDVQLEIDSPIWFHFNVYDANRDHRRCRSECRWMISREGLLFGYNQESKNWESFPFTIA